MAAGCQGFSPRTLDELICLLGDPMFQIPVKSFMDENCLMFDPSIEIESMHRDVYNTYHRLVENLLQGFCDDIHIGYDEAVRGIVHLSTAPELREVFYEMAEPVLAATDFDVFVRSMVRHNILIQEQVLRMILASTGALPESFTKGGVAAPQPISPARAAVPPQRQQHKEQREGVQEREYRTGGSSVRVKEYEEEEEEVLRQVFIQSQKDKDQSKKGTDDQFINDVKQNAELLKVERSNLEEDMKRLFIESKPLTNLKPQPVVTKIPGSKSQKSVDATAAVLSPGRKSASTKDSDKMSSAEAADNWLKSAQSEASATSSTHSSMASSMSQLNPDELKARQEFLRLQREKLLAIKKETREKQLGNEERSRPQRVQSASAARLALRQAPPSDEDKKKAARRALAEKLRAEVVDKEV